jgi:hypothetical protein
MNPIVPMQGHLTYEGQLLMRAGFLRPGVLPGGTLGPSTPIITRMIGHQFNSGETLQALQRGEAVGDINSALRDLGLTIADFQRAITSGTSNLPIRENLEAEAKILMPQDTPLRNRLPRTPGSGLASAWRQVTSLGGGYGATTTVTTGASSATQTVGSTAGMAPGDSLYFATTNATGVIASITSATVVVLSSSLSTTTGETVTKVGVQPAGGVGAVRSFYAETGAPADHSTVYAAKSLGYKLLGTYGSVTNFAISAGANYQNQLATEKRNALRNLMLNEENALINGSSTDVKAPWGDGTTALGFDGLVNLITTGNGTPSAQVQTSVGALTTAHLDAQLSRLWNQGAQDMWMLMNEQEIRSMAHLAEASGSIIRVQATSDGKAVLGVQVTGYVHAVSGKLVNILPSRFLSPGMIIFGCDRLPDGSPAADVDVLPQVQLPELAADEMIQGYTARDLAPTTSAPDVFPFMASVYEVLRVKSALHFAKSVGVTAV